MRSDLVTNLQTCQAWSLVEWMDAGVKIWSSKFTDRYRGFLKWWYPHFTPQVMIIFSRKTPWLLGKPTILGNPHIAQTWKVILGSLAFFFPQQDSAKMCVSGRGYYGLGFWTWSPAGPGHFLEGKNKKERTLLLMFQNSGQPVEGKVVEIPLFTGF